MAVHIDKKSWWVDITFNGKRHRKRSPENTRAGARAYEVVLRQKLARGEDIDNRPAILAQEESFETFAWKWYDEYVIPNNKHSVQRMKKYILAASLVPFFGKMPVQKITSHHVEQFKAQLLKKGKSNKTVNNHLGILSKLLVIAYEWRQFETVLPKVKLLKCPVPRTDYLTEDECELLLANSEGVVHEMILLALRTGMRQGELKGLQWTSIEGENHNLLVRHSQCDRQKTLTTPKSNRERLIPLNTEVYETLLKRKAAIGYVFLNTNGTPFTHGSMTRKLLEVCKKAGIRDIGWHTLRHTFATQLAEKGVPLNLVQALLGHSSISVTMRYAHAAPSAMRSAIELLNSGTAPEELGQPAVSQWLVQLSKEAGGKVLKLENL